MDWRNGMQSNGGSSGFQDGGLLTVGEANERRNRALSRLRRAVLAGDHRRAQDLTRRYLMSYAAKVTAVHRALRALKHSDVDVHQLAETLRAWTVPDEVARCIEEPKPAGGTRRLFSFGIRARALQYLVDDVLRAACPLPAFVVGVGSNHGEPSRGGWSAAVREIQRLMRPPLRGMPPIYEFAVVADVANCFDSVRGDAVVSALPIPEAVTRNVILCEGHRFSASQPRKRALRSRWSRRSIARRESVHRPSGVPQGSVVSGVVVATLFASLEDVVPEWCPMFMHGDDLCVLATSATEAEAIARNVDSYFDSHPAGPYALKRLEVHNLSEGFDYLGYEIVLGEDGPEARLSFHSRTKILGWADKELSRELMDGAYEPSEAFRAKLRKKLEGYNQLSDPDQVYEDLLDELERVFGTAADADLDGNEPRAGLARLRAGLEFIKHCERSTVARRTDTAPLGY